MSPEEAMKNPYVNITVNWLLSSLTVFLIFWFGMRNDASAKRDIDLELTLESKVDLNYAESTYIKKIDAATKLYVKEAIVNHSKIEQVRYDNIEKMFTIIMTDISTTKEDIKDIIKEQSRN